ncbi:hypothetical protein EJB05_10637, partial [Eragrostis curvula]
MATTPSLLSAGLGRLVVIEPPAGSLAPRRLVVAPAGARLPQGVRPVALVAVSATRGGRAVYAPEADGVVAYVAVPATATRGPLTGHAARGGHVAAAGFGVASGGRSSSRGGDTVAAAAGHGFASVGFPASAGDCASRGAPTAVGVGLVSPAVATGVLEGKDTRGPRVSSFASAHGGSAVASAKGNGVASVAATRGSLTGRVGLAEAGAGGAAASLGHRPVATPDVAYVAVPAATCGSLTGTRGGQAALCFAVAGAGGQASRGGQAALSLTALQVGGGGFPSPRRAGFAVPFVAVAAGAKSLNTGLLAGAGGLRACRGAYVVTAAAAGVPGEGAADDENVITPDGAPMEEPPVIDVSKGEGQDDLEGEPDFVICMPYYDDKVSSLIQKTAVRAIELLGTVKEEDSAYTSDGSIDWAMSCLGRVQLQAEKGFAVAEDVVEATRSMKLVYLAVASNRRNILPFPEFLDELPIYITADPNILFTVLAEDFARGVVAVEGLV